MKLILDLSIEESEFLKCLMDENDELIVPIALWIEHIEKNSLIKKEDFPPRLILSEYVITKREWFCDVVKSLKYLYFEQKRLTKEQGGVWLISKLEFKKKMPKHDIFNVGVRQHGSFKSNG